ncbi:hypothetical protein AUP68_09005 [Ilyonectria robusta]
MDPEASDLLPQIQDTGSPGKRLACRQCRARKVKCDRRPDGCLRCERLDFVCSYASVDGISPRENDDSPQELTQAGTKRRRASKACTSCRATKAKCSGNYPCQRCESHGQECLFPIPRTTAQADVTPEALVSPASTQAERYESAQPPPPAASPGEDSTRAFELEKKDDVRNYIHAYFDKSDFLDSLSLHRATVLTEWSRGNLDKTLLKAICASGLRLMSPQEAYLSPLRWVDEIQTELVARIGDISVPKLHALVIVITFHSTLKFTGDIWVLLSIAARVAFTKRLNYERSAVDSITQECLRRLMWSIYRLDKVFSGGIEDLTVCPINRLHVRLPNSHHNFQLGLRSSVQFLRHMDEGTDMNILAYLIRMYDLRDRIFRLMIMCHSEEARGYIVLHTLLYLCRCDLFRFLIPGIRESVSADAMEQTPRAYIDYCQQRCLESAVWCCEFWSHIRHSEMRNPVEGATLTIALYQCTKIIDHLYFLLPPEGGHSLPQLKQKLQDGLFLASRGQDKCEWVSLCISDVEKLIPGLGMRPPLSDTPPPPGTLSEQEKLHRRSKYVFTTEDEDNIGSAVNPRRSTADETLAATTSTSDAGTGSETWPFSMPGQNEETVEYSGRNSLGSAQFFGDGLVPYDLSSQVTSSFDDQDLTLSMNPFDLQMNAYTDADIPPFLAQIE